MLHIMPSSWSIARMRSRLSRSVMVSRSIGYEHEEVRALLAVHNMRGGERFYLAWAGARIGPVYAAGIADDGGRFRYVVEPVKP